MTDLFVKEVTEKLMLLERRTGASVKYNIFPPLPQPLFAAGAIQVAAKDIAEFVGLPWLTFVVGFAKQKEGVAGHIELKYSGKEVYIEIEPMTGFPDVVAATLCHEICHKWLQVKGIVQPIEIENERLTDITAVFLGLGKIMLNGCVSTDEETHPNGTRVTRTMKSGYLSRDEFAFVYRLVCAMRKIPASEYLRDLYPDAAGDIHFCDSSFGHHYHPRFHKPETIQDLVNQYQKDITTVQRELSELDKHLIYIMKSFCNTVNGFLGTGHKMLHSLRQKSDELTSNEPDPAFRFLRTVQSKLQLENTSEELQNLTRKTIKYLRHGRSLGRHLSRNPDYFSPPTPDLFNIVTCHIDGTKLRLPIESGNLSVTCKKCKYRFAYSTAPITFPEQLFFRTRNWLILAALAVMVVIWIFSGNQIPSTDTPLPQLARMHKLLNIQSKSDVIRIQQKLSALGYYRMKVDGKWGAGSRSALRVFKMARTTETWDLKTQRLLFGK